MSYINVTVVFKPTEAKAYSDNLTLTTNAASSPDAVPLTGTGYDVSLDTSQYNGNRADTYGIMKEQLIGNSFPKQYTEEEIRGQIKAGLLLNPAIAEVRNLSVTLSGDSLAVEFTVVKTDGSIFNISELL